MSLTKVSYSMISGAAVNVLDYGAVAGQDSTTAIQAALNTGKDVYIPTVSTPFLSGNLTVSTAGQTIFGNNGNSAIKLKNNANASLFTISANYVTICSVGLDGNKANQTDNTDVNASAVWSTGVSNLTVENCNISNFKRNGIASSFQNEYCIYKNNRIVNCDFIGIYNINSGAPLLRSVITENEIQSCGQDGIGTVGFQYCTISNNVVKNCTVAQISQESNCNFTTVSGNTVVGTGLSDTSNGIQSNDSNSVSIVGNSIYGVSNGVSVSGGSTSRSVSVTGNSIDSCKTGLLVDASSAQSPSLLNCYKYGVTITGNVIKNSREVAIWLNAVSGVSVTSNQIINFATDVSSESVSRNRAAIALRSYACFNVVNDNYIYDDSSSALKIAFLELYDGSQQSLSNSFNNNVIQNVVNDYGLQWSNINASTVVRPLRTSSAPTTGTWATGQISYNTYPASGGYIGWVSSDNRGGSFGTATTTGSMTSGSQSLVVASTDGFNEGMTITVAGAITDSVILQINHTTKTMALLDVAGATVSGAAVALKNPVFKTWGVIS